MLEIGRRTKCGAEAVRQSMNWTGEIDLSDIPNEELEAMRDAGECVRECYRILKQTNDSIVSEYLKRRANPDSNIQDVATPVIDSKTNSQYWFHSDRIEQQPNETGHFHTFVRPRKIPRVGAQATAPPGYGPNDAWEDSLCHIIAIAMDHTGFPKRLFAPNKWVVRSAWHKAADVCHHLSYFTIEHADPSYPVNVWITNMIVLFRPEIRRILTERDRMIAALRQQHPEQDVLENRNLVVTVDQPIDVMRQLYTVREELRNRKGAAYRTADEVDAAAYVTTAERVREQTREQAVEAALQQQIQTLHNSVLSARTTAQALEEQLDATRRKAWEDEKEHERQVSELRAAHERESAQRLLDVKTRLETKFREHVVAMQAKWRADMEARLASVRRETQETLGAARAAAVDELREQWDIESRKNTAEVVANRKVEEARRLTAAKEKWARASREAVAERDRVWQIAFEHRVEAALDAWRVDEETRLAQAKAEWNAERKLRRAHRQKIAWWLRRIRVVLLVAAVIGGAAALYPVVKPAVVDLWNETVVGNWTALRTRLSLSIYALKARFESREHVPETPKANASTPVAPRRMINVGAANLRSAPSRTAAIIGILLEGTHVSRLERRGQWVRVRTLGAKGQVGWVHISLLADLPTP